MTWLSDQDSNNEEKIWMNVRGNIGFFKRYLITLVPKSDLYKLFTGQMPDVKYVDGRPFLNRDPEAFKNVIFYLANKMSIPKLDNFRHTQLLDELDYWKIPYHIPTELEKLDAIFKKAPQFVSKSCLQKWTDDVHALDIAKLSQKHVFVIQESL